MVPLLSRLEFVLNNGNLKHTKSGKCVQPMGAITDGVTLGLYSTCEGHQFSFTTGGSLQHVGSKKCVNTKSGVNITFCVKCMHTATRNRNRTIDLFENQFYVFRKVLDLFLLKA